MKMLNVRLARPIINSNYILRERLNNVLDRNISKPLGLVVAGAGYGKSIVISQWLEQSGQKSCWMNLDASSDNFRNFSEYLIEAIRSVYPKALNESLNMINSLEVDSYKILSETLINELLELDEELCLVLDDYHVIRNDEIHSLLEMILNYLAGRVNVILISRNDPPLKIDHLEAYDNVFEIRGKDLRLTTDELHSLSEQLYYYKLTEEQANSILYTTEGWVIAARLQLKIISEGVNVDDATLQLEDKQINLMEHMFHEVITIEQDDIFKGLLLASISERFTIDMIISLMASDTTNNAFDPDLFRERFSEALNKSMFVFRLDHHQEWYRFHRLVHDLLQKKVRQRYSKNQIKNLYVEASRYFESIQSYEEALDTALGGDDIDFAVSIILANYSALLDTEQFQRLGSWLNMLPAGTVECHPELLMVRAVLHETKSDYHSLSCDLELLGQISAILDKHKADGNRIWTWYYALYAGYYFFTRKYEKVNEMADITLELLKEKYSYVHSYIVIIKSLNLQVTGEGKTANELLDSYQSSLPEENRIGLLRIHLSRIFMMTIQGKINRVSNSVNFVKQIGEEQKKWVTLAMANYYLAASNYYRNKQEGVISIYQESRRKGFAGRPNFVLHTGYYAILEMIANKDFKGARQIISDLYDYTRKISNSEFDNLVKAFEVELELLQGNLSTAQELALQVNFGESRSILFFYIPSMTKIKLMFADPDCNRDDTRQALEELISKKEKLNLMQILVQAYPLMAIWHLRYGNINDALTYLRKTLAIAEEGGFFRIFLDLGQEIKTLLGYLTQEEKANPFVNKILNSHFSSGNELLLTGSQEGISEAKAIQDRNYHHLSPEITQREAEILDLVVKGYPNKQIAESLFLSHGTVKTYVYNIYRKIEVKNRFEAIVKAKEFGFATM